MKKRFEKIQVKGEFAKNAFVLTIGTSIAQAFPLLFYPILVRIYTPEDFGILATITSITAIITILSTGRYEASILISETKQDAANIIGLVLLLSFSILTISFLILQLFSNHISIWFNAPSLEKWLFIIPINAFLVVIYNCYNEWCIRQKHFTSITYNKIINASATTLGKLILGIAKFTSNGLIIGDLLGRIISTCSCIFNAFNNDKEVFSQISIGKIKSLSKKYIEFPKFFMPGELLNSFGGQMPVFLIGVFFNSIEVGFYAVTITVLSVPISIISLAIRDIFRQRANDDYIKTGSCRNIFTKTFLLLSALAIPGALILVFILPDLFSFVLGNKWQTAGVYSQILTPMIALAFVSNSLSSTLIIANKIKVTLIFQIYYFSITLISLLLGFWIFHNIKTTLISFAIGRGSAYILELYLSYKYSSSSNTLKNIGINN